MSFTIDILSAFADNYIYLVTDRDIGLSMVVDPGDADVVLRALKKQDLHLSLILNTHHHKDHVGGNARLQKEYGAPIIGPAAEQNRIENLARGVENGHSVTFSTLRGTVIEVHGHTAGHIAFHFPQLKALFCGDTLFSLGCGRLFEGTAAELWASLCRLRALPDDTQIYCGHEYTEANAKFALMLDKNNAALKARAAAVAELRKKGLPTIPSLLGDEKKTNPFLRVDQPDFLAELTRNGFPAQGTDAAAIFGALRAAKDRFNAEGV